jgi:hypothetical protein
MQSEPPSGNTCSELLSIASTAMGDVKLLVSFGLILNVIGSEYEENFPVIQLNYIL